MEPRMTPVISASNKNDVGLITVGGGDGFLHSMRLDSMLGGGGGGSLGRETILSGSVRFLSEGSMLASQD